MTAARRPIFLDADGLKRLRASIAHWERLAEGKWLPGEAVNSDHCALCKRWLASACTTSSADQCPVYQATAKTACSRTPFHSASFAEDRYGLDSPEFRAAAEAELAFLRDLLARVEEKP